MFPPFYKPDRTQHDKETSKKIQKCKYNCIKEFSDEVVLKSDNIETGSFYTDNKDFERKTANLQKFRSHVLKLTKATWPYFRASSNKCIVNNCWKNHLNEKCQKCQLPCYKERTGKIWKKCIIQNGCDRLPSCGFTQKPKAYYGCVDDCWLQSYMIKFHGFRDWAKECKPQCSRDCKFVSFHRTPIFDLGSFSKDKGTHPKPYTKVKGHVKKCRNCIEKKCSV